MDRKYIMIDSTYRDRLLYPNPSEFIIPMNSPVGSNVFNSKNPLVNGYPITNFCFLSDTGEFSGAVVGGNPRAIQVDPSIDDLTGIDLPNIATTIVQAMDMFINLLFRIDGDDNVYRIAGYDSVRHIIYLDTPVLNFVVGAGYTIQNPSTAQSIILQGYKLTYNGFPNNNDGYFIASSKAIYVWDLTLGEYRTGHLSNTSVVLDEPFSAGWRVSDQYMVSLTTNPVMMSKFTEIAPNVRCLLSGVWKHTITYAGAGYTGNMIVKLVSAAESRPDYAIASARVLYTGANGCISQLQLLYCGEGYATNAEYYLLPDGGVFDVGLARVRIIQTATGFVMNGHADALCGCYMVPILSTPQFQYIGSTNKVKLSPNQSVPFVPEKTMEHVSIVGGNTLNGATPIVDTLTYNGQTIILTQPFEGDAYLRFGANNLGDFASSSLFAVLPFYRDGCVSMDYRGSTVSSNQMVCYAMTVNTLILPNQILNLPFGSLTSSYPYVLLEITNETASSGHNKSVIYSNNPNTVSATFVCSISDVNSPLITKFINISSDRATQIIKFKPNDALRFRLSMPDGRPFETELKDYLPPLQPNPLIQLNCLIEIIRL